MVNIPPRSDSLETMAVNNVYKGPLDIMKEHGCIRALNAHCYVCTRCFDCRAVIHAAQEEHGDSFMDPIFKQALAEIADIHEKVNDWSFPNVPKSTDIVLWKTRLSFIDDNLTPVLAKLRVFTNSTDNPKTIIRFERDYHERIAKCFHALSEISDFVDTYEIGARIKANGSCDKPVQTEAVDTPPVSTLVTDDFKAKLEETLAKRMLPEPCSQSKAANGFHLPVPTFHEAKIDVSTAESEHDTMRKKSYVLFQYNVENRGNRWSDKTFTMNNTIGEISDELDHINHKKKVHEDTQKYKSVLDEIRTKVVIEEPEDTILSEIKTPVLGQIHNMEEDDAMWETIYVTRDDQEPEF